MAHKSRDTLKLTWKFDLGGDGEDADPKNPIARALDNLLSHGTPSRKFAHALFTPNPTGARPELRWLGVFVHTDRGRIVFFPGYFLRLLQYANGRSMQQVRQFEIDHVTLENDFRTWHVTGTADDRQGGMRTRDLENGRYLWFGMSVAQPDVLRAVMKRTTITGLSPGSDSRRRISCFRSARQDVHDFIVVPPQEWKSKEHSFLHFSVIVGRTPFAEYRGPDIALPEGSPLVHDLPPIGSPFPVSSHLNQLDDDAYLQVTCARVQGRLDQPVVFAW